MLKVLNKNLLKKPLKSGLCLSLYKYYPRVYFGSSEGNENTQQSISEEEAQNNKLFEEAYYNSFHQKYQSYGDLKGFESSKQQIKEYVDYWNKNAQERNKVLIEKQKSRFGGNYQRVQKTFYMQKDITFNNKTYFEGQYTQMHRDFNPELFTFKDGFDYENSENYIKELKPHQLTYLDFKKSSIQNLLTKKPVPDIPESLLIDEYVPINLLKDTPTNMVMLCNFTELVTDKDIASLILSTGNVLKYQIYYDLIGLPAYAQVYYHTQEHAFHVKKQFNRTKLKNCVVYIKNFEDAETEKAEKRTLVIEGLNPLSTAENILNSLSLAGRPLNFEMLEYNSAQRLPTKQELIDYFTEELGDPNFQQKYYLYEYSIAQEFTNPLDNYYKSIKKDAKTEFKEPHIDYNSYLKQDIVDTQDVFEHLQEDRVEYYKQKILEYTKREQLPYEESKGQIIKMLKENLSRKQINEIGHGQKNKMSEQFLLNLENKSVKGTQDISYRDLLEYLRTYEEKKMLNMGYCFVTFTTSDEAKRAFLRYNTTILDKASVKVQLKNNKRHLDFDQEWIMRFVREQKVLKQKGNFEMTEEQQLQRIKDTVEMDKLQYKQKILGDQFDDKLKVAQTKRDRVLVKDDNQDLYSYAAQDEFERRKKVKKEANQFFEDITGKQIFTQQEKVENVLDYSLKHVDTREVGRSFSIESNEQDLEQFMNLLNHPRNQIKFSEVSDLEKQEFHELSEDKTALEYLRKEYRESAEEVYEFKEQSINRKEGKKFYTLGAGKEFRKKFAGDKQFNVQKNTNRSKRIKEDWEDVFDTKAAKLGINPYYPEREFDDIDQSIKTKEPGYERLVLVKKLRPDEEIHEQDIQQQSATGEQVEEELGIDDEDAPIGNIDDGDQGYYDPFKQKGYFSPRQNSMLKSVQQQDNSMGKSTKKYSTRVGEKYTVGINRYRVGKLSAVTYGQVQQQQQQQVISDSLDKKQQYLKERKEQLEQNPSNTIDIDEMFTLYYNQMKDPAQKVKFQDFLTQIRDIDGQQYVTLEDINRFDEDEKLADEEKYLSRKEEEKRMERLGDMRTLEDRFNQDDSIKTLFYFVLEQLFEGVPYQQYEYNQEEIGMPIDEYIAQLNNTAQPGYKYDSLIEKQYNKTYIVELLTPPFKYDWEHIHKITNNLIPNDNIKEFIFSDPDITQDKKQQLYEYYLQTQSQITQQSDPYLLSTLNNKNYLELQQVFGKIPEKWTNQDQSRFELIETMKNLRAYTDPDIYNDYDNIRRELVLRSIYEYVKIKTSAYTKDDFIKFSGQFARQKDDKGKYQVSKFKVA